MAWFQKKRVDSLFDNTKDSSEKDLVFITYKGLTAPVTCTEEFKGSSNTILNFLRSIGVSLEKYIAKAGRCETGDP
ncbi:unnamed protein product [Sphenostylis stenocarpa]|uniref:Uncharacterized protein n=1 Tax=Sphenostylis stenocarpa TaxID=92480 RepID=A0AA86S2Z9_9FABA|nr:unnamed protein product [Sphenostylis stenocarpa]